MHYFSIFLKKLTNHELFFRAFGRKAQIVGKFWKSLMKVQYKNWICFIIFGKFVTKNRAFGNNHFSTIFSVSSPPLNPPMDFIRKSMLSFSESIIYMLKQIFSWPWEAMFYAAHSHTPQHLLVLLWHPQLQGEWSVIDQVSFGNFELLLHSQLEGGFR